MEGIRDDEGNDLEGGTRDDGGDLGGGVGDDDDLDTITPKVGMEFPTQVDAYKYYNRYALKMGFGARWASTCKSRVDPNLVISRKFVCSKEGKKLLKKPTVEGEVHQHRQTREMLPNFQHIGGNQHYATFKSSPNLMCSLPGTRSL